MVAASFIAIITQCQYYNHTGYKIIVFKFIAKAKQIKLFWVTNPLDGGSAWPVLKIRHWQRGYPPSPRKIIWQTQELSKQLYPNQSTTLGASYIYAVEQQPVPQQLSAKTYTGTLKKTARQTLVALRNIIMIQPSSIRQAELACTDNLNVAIIGKLF